MICDLLSSENPWNSSGPFPTCASHGSAKLQEPLGRERSVGSGAPLGWVNLVDRGAALLTADLRLETQNMLANAAKDRHRYTG